MPTEHNLLIKAKEAIENNQLIQAGEYLDQLLREEPNNDEAWALAAKIIHDPTKKLEYIDKALQSDPTNFHHQKVRSTITGKIKRVSVFVSILTLTILGTTLALLIRNAFQFEPIEQANLPAPTLINAPLPLSTSTPFSKREWNVPTRTPTRTPVPLVNFDSLQLSSENLRSIDNSDIISPAIKSPIMSHDGQFIAYESKDDAGFSNIYLYDVQNQKHDLISFGLDVELANGSSHAPSISADGQIVAFESNASNLVANDRNNGKDIFVYDHEDQTIQLISTSFNVEQTDAKFNEAMSPSVSPDGNFIAFVSTASSIVSNDTNKASDVFVYDRTTNETVRVSVSSAGEQANEQSLNPAISNNGEYVVFTSFANNLIETKVSRHSHIYLHDTKNKTTKIISDIEVSTSSQSDNPQISADGNIIAFATYSQNLVPSDTNQHLDIFIYNQETQLLTRASEGFDHLEKSAFQPNFLHTHYSLSPNGRYVVFGQSTEHLESNMTTTDLPKSFIFDNLNNETKILGLQAEVIAKGSKFYDGSISTDGKTLIFISLAPPSINESLPRDLRLYLYEKEMEIFN